MPHSILQPDLVIKRPFRCPLTLQMLFFAALFPSASPALFAGQSHVTVQTSRAQDKRANPYRQVKSEAQNLMRWCALKRYTDGQIWAASIALRFGGPDNMISSNLKRLHANRMSSKNVKASKTPNGFMAERAKVSKVASPLFGMWQEAQKAGDLSLATELAQDLAAADPEHEATHKALGYVRHNEKWMSPRSKVFLEKGGIKDPVFGWVMKENLPHYRKGKRLLHKKMVSKVEADQAHRDKNNPYRIMTEHFHIYSCRPLEEAILFAHKAEALHDTWVHLFPYFLDGYGGEQGSQNNGRLPGVDLKTSMPMRIYYAHDRRQYEELSGMKGGRGNYDLGRRCSFFFPQGNGQGVLDSIFYHEVTHQLFVAYSLGRLRGLGLMKATVGANNFLNEGLATFMEGFENAGGKLHLSALTKSSLSFGSNTIHGPLRIKLAASYFRQGIAEPLTTLLSLNHQTFYVGPVVRNQRLDRYSESAALIHFLMLGQERKYRKPFVQFARDFYNGQALSKDALAKSLKISTAKIETQWKQYMSTIPSVR